jgi:hypothetical protein
LPATLFLSLALLAGCSSTSSTGSAPAGGDATSATEVLAAPKPKTADEITKALAERIPSASPAKVFTAEDDPNKLLGRPNGYTSKTAFTDTRIPVEGEVEFTKENDTLRGGGVEVFGDADAAKARMDYIQSFGKATPMLAEYDYTSGGVLLRVSKILTPDQAAEYESALKAVLG